MIRLRKILFIIFVGLYLILCPAIILYCLGIIIRPGQEKVIKTGIIHVSSLPPGASITLNGKLLNEVTPATLNNLIPGSYTLELNARKYHSWTKTVTVDPEKVTPVENLLLIPDPFTIHTISSAPTEMIIPVPGNPYLLAVNGPTIADIFIYVWDEGIGQNLLTDNETKSSKLRPIIPAEFQERGARLVELYTARNSPYILLEIQSNEDKTLLWIDPLFSTPKVEDISDLFPDIPDNIQWDGSDARHILSFQNNSLNRLDLSTKAIYPRIIDGIEHFSLFGQEMAVLSEDRELKRANSTGTSIETYLDDPGFNDLVFTHYPYEKITAVSDNTAFLLGRNGALLSTLKPYLLAPQDIQGFKWNDRPARLLVWTRRAIGLIDFSRRTADPAEMPSIHWLTNHPANITDAFWVNDGTHILYVDNSALYLTDLSDESQPVQIIEIKKNSAVHYADKIGKAFFLSKDDSRLSSIEIVPQHPIIRGISFEKKKRPVTKP